MTSTFFFYVFDGGTRCVNRPAESADGDLGARYSAGSGDCFR